MGSEDENAREYHSFISILLRTYFHWDECAGKPGFHKDAKSNLEMAYWTVQDWEKPKLVKIKVFFSHHMLARTFFCLHNSIAFLKYLFLLCNILNNKEWLTNKTIFQLLNSLPDFA